MGVVALALTLALHVQVVMAVLMLELYQVAIQPFLRVEPAALLTPMEDQVTQDQQLVVYY